MPRESILNPAMHIGIPDKSSFVVEGTPLLGFKEILGLAPRFATIYSIIVEESYSESAKTDLPKMIKTAVLEYFPLLHQAGQRQSFSGDTGTIS